MENNEPQVLNEELEQTTAANSNIAEAADVAEQTANSATDINKLTREELVKLVSEKAAAPKATSVAREIDEIKKRFDILTAEAHKNQRDAYAAEHDGNADGFEISSDDADIDMQTECSKFASRLAIEQSANLDNKISILNKMEELLKGDDISKFSHEFRDQIAAWKTFGSVPPQDAQNINLRYKQATNDFFDRVKISREMRELDLKRNLEEKTRLCEEAEKLAATPSATKSFNQIQALHAQWKQIGAVPAEVREDLWARFKAATAVVNERFHKFIDENREREKSNYEAKKALISEMEQIANSDLETSKAIDAAVRKTTELQEKWRTIGVVPKAVNTQVYADFRKLCDVVFNKRRAFYKEQNNVLKANLEQKQKLIEQAEAMMNSTEWKETFDKYVAIQKKWKTIGPVPHKVSDSVWTKFKTACDHFFEQRDKAMGTEDAEREKNLEKKTALLAELKGTKLPEEPDELFKTIQGFQQKWNQIGPLPNKKREIHQEFMDIVNKLYDKCASDDASKNVQRFRAKMELLKDSPDGAQKLNQERNRLINKLKQTEAEYKTLENNIGFFSKSKNSDNLRNDFENKLKTAKRNIDQINEKLDIIDAIID